MVNMAVVLAGHLDLMILEVFFNFKHSMILQNKHSLAGLLHDRDVLPPTLQVRSISGSLLLKLCASETLRTIR